MATIAHPPSPGSSTRLDLPLAARPSALGNILAVASIVIRELYRRKDFYVLFVLTALITLVMGSVNFFQQENVGRYLKEICLFLIWVSSLVIAVATTARQIPAEREHRTLFPLLAKPITRSQVLLGKFAGCWFATGIALLLFYSFFGLVAGWRDHDWPLVNYAQALTLHWLMLGVVCALTMLGSLVLAAPSSTVTIVLVVTTGILLVGRHLNKVALRLEEPGQTLLYAVYYLIPHLELFDLRDLIVHGWSAVAWPVFAGAVAYALAYTTLFLTAACLVFRRRAIQ